jgi:hypothetical protein
LSLWFLLLSALMVPLCHAPSGLSLDGQAVVLCHAESQQTHPADDDDPAGNAAHCPLCFVCHMLSGGMSVPAPAADLAVPVRIAEPALPGREVLPSIRLAYGPPQARAPPESL